MSILPQLVLTLICVQDPGTPAAAAESDAMQLSLADAIEAFFVNNLGLRGSDLETQASLAGFGSAWGAFDSVFFTDVTRSETFNAPSPSNFVGGVDVGGSPTTEFDLFNFRSGVRGQFPSGTTWQLDIGSTETKTSTPKFSTRQLDQNGDPAFHPVTGEPLFNNVSSQRSKVITGAWNLSLTQPLLRGGEDGLNATALELAAKDVSLSAIAAQELADAILVTVVEAYWNLVFARQHVATVDLSVELANELLAITERKYAQGLQNRLDVIQVEADLARRHEEALTAENEVLQAVDDLRQLVFAPEEQSEWSREIVPTTDYEVDQGIEVDAPAALADALRFRPDVASARLSVERADIEVRRAENQALPRLDVTGGYGLNSNETNLARSVTRLDDADLYDARITLNLEVPFGNRTAGYALRRRRLDRERSAVSLREVEMTAVSEVRSAVRNVNLQEQRVVATAESRRLRLEAYEGEKRRLENDLSTPFGVRESQRDFLTAVDDEKRAQLDLAVARTSLLAASGMLLQHYGYRAYDPVVSLEEAPPAP
jgi:outer membrane protein